MTGQPGRGGPQLIGRHEECAPCASCAPRPPRQDVMAYLRLAVGLRDDVALARIINTPK